MSIADKLQTIAENEQKVYKAGYDSAVKEGDTTLFTDFSQTLTISGFPSLPKTFTMIGLRSAIPTDDNQYFIAGLNFFREGFNFTGGNSQDLIATVWLRVTTNVSSTAAGNGTITKVRGDKVFTFENGNFTIDLSKYNTKYGFGANYAYKWAATF